MNQTLTEASDADVRVSVAILADMIEERWPSMDLVAEMLSDQLNALAAEAGEPKIRATLLRPRMRRRFSRPDGQGRGFTADRVLGRFVDYPRYLGTRRGEFDLFHLADHSYSQLLHRLPAERTVVTCHDLDTFRSLWDAGGTRRGFLFRAMTQRILSGFQKAAHVCCDSAATRDEIVDKALVPANRLSVIPLGVHPAFLQPPSAAAESAVQSMLSTTPGAPDDPVDLLHVGSVIPRKRIDVLLEVFARIAAVNPRVRLLRVGGRLTSAQQALADRLRISHRVVTLPFLDVQQVAAVYRRVALTLLPSDAEGFGFPVVESMACGTPIVASELAVLREVGGDAAEYAPVADLDAWTARVMRLLEERSDKGEEWERRRELSRAQASKFTWAETARRYRELYQQVLGGVERTQQVR